MHPVVKVIDADRELFITLSNADGQMAESIQCGRSFTWEVEQVARHRQYGYDHGYYDGRKGDGAEVIAERLKITAWLRSLDEGSGDINRFIPTTLANWIEEEMHLLPERRKT